MRIGIEAQRIFRKKKHGMDIVALELIKALQLIDKQNQYFILMFKGQWQSPRMLEFRGYASYAIGSRLVSTSGRSMDGKFLAVAQ